MFTTTKITQIRMSQNYSFPSSAYFVIDCLKQRFLEINKDTLFAISANDYHGLSIYYNHR